MGLGRCSYNSRVLTRHLLSIRTIYVSALFVRNFCLLHSSIAIQYLQWRYTPTPRVLSPSRSSIAHQCIISIKRSPFPFPVSQGLPRLGTCIIVPSRLPVRYLLVLKPAAHPIIKESAIASAHCSALFIFRLTLLTHAPRNLGNRILKRKTAPSLEPDFITISSRV